MRFMRGVGAERSRPVGGAALLAALLALAGCDDPKPAAAGAAAAPAVTVSAPVQRRLTEWDEYTGRFASAERVEIRPRVNGYLDTVHFEDGQIVKEGDLLFTIDPRPYDAAVAGAEATLAQARARVVFARGQVERAQELRRTDAIAGSTSDQRLQELQVAAAEALGAEAAAARARLDVEFTQVRAPVAGLYASPTVINNVESIASVPSIIEHGAEWFASMGTEKSKGYGIFSLSGHVTKPGQYEAPLGITLRELIDLAGGMREGHQLKFWTPGGSSTPLLTEEHLDVPLDFEGVAGVGSMLGTRALQLFDETTCVVRAVLRWTEFYKHESCGKCTPCREGTYWLLQILERMLHHEGTEEDIETMLDICDNILGRSFCALGDGATSPVTSSIQYFREEYLEHLRHGGCPFDRDASSLFVKETASA